MTDLLKFGYPRTGDVINAVLSVSKDFWQSDVHLKGVSLVNNLFKHVKGDAILA